MSQPPLLSAPVGAAVRRVADGHLADAAAALARLKTPSDTEALHDFRVAIRRLRSLLRAYRRWLGRAAGKKVRRRLRELGQTTNAGRDAEVQLAWIASHRDGLSRGERSGYAWLGRRLRERKREGYRAARKHVRASFGRTGEMLVRRLEGLVPDGPTFQAAFATLLREHLADLEARLAAVRSAADEDEAHEARISAKRLRYLLEPVRAELPAVRPIITTLKGLQDVLGDLHDAHVVAATLAEEVEVAATEKARRLHELALAGDDGALGRERRRDERVGLVALAARAQTRGDAHFAALAKGWLGGAARPLVTDLRALADSLLVEGVPVERERKFLLTALPDRARTAPAEEIEQGWLPGARLRERLRRTQRADGTRYFRTVKLGAGVTRIELEEETTAELFDALWPHTSGRRVVKRRYRVPEGDHVWEIDDFPDRSLVLAEIELADGEDQVTLPTWLSPHVVRDVTDDPAYLNVNLAR